MTDIEVIETKDKIISAARILFANHGFEGTSIRDIAREAEVNIASVNYHFTNKENLFAAILSMGYLQCSKAMREMYDRNQPNLEDSLIFLFRYFLDQSHDLLTYFKMMMSTQHSHHILAQGTEDEMVGPPGGKVIIEAMMKEVSGKVSDEDLFWGIRSLFSNVVHTSLMYHCCFKQNSIPFTSLEDIEKGIRRLSKVVVRELKSVAK